LCNLSSTGLGMVILLGQPKIHLSTQGSQGSRDHKSNLSGPLVNTRQIYLRDKIQSRRIVRIVTSAVDIDTVYPILMYTLLGVSA
jgi:hypothetical protein